MPWAFRASSQHRKRRTRRSLAAAAAAALPASRRCIEGFVRLPGTHSILLRRQDEHGCCPSHRTLRCWQEKHEWLRVMRGCMLSAIVSLSLYRSISLSLRSVHAAAASDIDRLSFPELAHGAQSRIPRSITRSRRRAGWLGPGGCKEKSNKTEQASKKKRKEARAEQRTQGTVPVWLKIPLFKGDGDRLSRWFSLDTSLYITIRMAAEDLVTPEQHHQQPPQRSR